MSTTPKSKGRTVAPDRPFRDCPFTTADLRRWYITEGLQVWQIMDKMRDEYGLVRTRASVHAWLQVAGIKRHEKIEPARLTGVSVVGDNIARVRVSKGLSQRRLAKIANTGLAAGTINEYEAGKRMPTIRILERLASAMDCDLAELVTKGSTVASTSQPS